MYIFLSKRIWIKFVHGKDIIPLWVISYFNRMAREKVLEFKGIDLRSFEYSIDLRIFPFHLDFPIYFYVYFTTIIHNSFK